MSIYLKWDIRNPLRAVYPKSFDVVRCLSLCPPYATFVHPRHNMKRKSAVKCEISFSPNLISHANTNRGVSKKSIGQNAYKFYLSSFMSRKHIGNNAFSAASKNANSRSQGRDGDSRIFVRNNGIFCYIEMCRTKKSQGEKISCREWISVQMNATNTLRIFEKLRIHSSILNINVYTI